ncbi:MAG: type III-B CRISPR module-associated protein Cmr3 [Thermoanaerobaculia bacterium]|nr:type III-B CRISPR module-associated protein Cmr3 [Thermoanaerobaculia bacterium]
MTDYVFHVDPVEPLLFGDNRSARLGSDHQLQDQDPSPLTFLGVLGSHLIDTQGAGSWPGEVLGRQEDDILSPRDAQGGGAAGVLNDLAELLGFSYRDDQGRPWFPRPLHFVFERIEDAPFPGGYLSPVTFDERTASSCSLPRYLDRRGGKEVEEFEETLLVSRELLTGLLCAKSVYGQDLERVHLVCRARHALKKEVRAGIEMDNALNSVEEGRLFTRPYRRFRPAGPDSQSLSFGFSTWFRTLAPLSPEAREKRTVFAGGDRRRAVLTGEPLAGLPLDGILNAVLSCPKLASSEGFIAYLLTPAIQEKAPPRLGNREPVAAATGKPQFASGWNVKLARPRPIVSLTPAGSVFFYKWEKDDDRADFIRTNWLSSISPGRHAGFGRVLIGVWP